jgi:molybdopterin converting factor small subunit
LRSLLPLLLEHRTTAGDTRVPVKVVLPTALARHTDGQKSFESQAADLPGLLAKFPALAQNVKDEHGKLRRFINVYVNDEDIRFLGGDSHQFEDGDEVMLIPSIAGGC